MQKIILEISDAGHASLCAPVFLEHSCDLPLGVKQAVEDFLEAHAGSLNPPLVITARQVSDVDALEPLTHSAS